MQKTPEEWMRLGTQAKWNHFNKKVNSRSQMASSFLTSPFPLPSFLAQVVSMAAYCEVMQGILLVIELILPTRNIMYTVIWWQYLQAR
jgi:hypothetical protein